MDAVVRTGGKQYRVQAGSVLNVATMDAELGSKVELREVLLITNDGTVTVGTPTVADAVVVAEVIQHGKGKKVINFKYKAKVRYRRKRGHRQGYTTLAVSEIRLGDISELAPPRRVAAAPSDEAPASEEAAPDATAPDAPETEAPVAEAAVATPRRRSRAASGSDEPTAEAPAATPRRRAAAKPKAEATPADDAPATESEPAAKAPRRRRTPKTEPETET